jgi:hypothetical protein
MPTFARSIPTLPDGPAARIGKAADAPKAVAACFAVAHPEIAWEPVALVAAASNAKRDLDRTAGADPLAETVSLPPESATSSAVTGAVFLPLPRGFI